MGNKHKHSKEIKCVKESPYYIGHNTTSAPGVKLYNRENLAAGCTFFEAKENGVFPKIIEDDGSKLSKSLDLENQSTPEKLKCQSLDVTAQLGSTTESRKAPQDPSEEPQVAPHRLSFFKGNALAVTRVAASFYNGGWLPSSGQVTTDRVDSLNEFLRESRTEVEAGLPGRCLTVIIGSQNSGLGPLVSTIVYAYLLHLNRKAKDQCFVPVINMKRSDMAVHTEALWLFKTVQLDIESLIFADEISLSYYHRFGILKLVLVDQHAPEPPFETLKDVVVEALHGRMGISANTQDNEMAVSCCTLVAERCASDAPEVLLGRGLSRLLLAGILLDTCNLDLVNDQCSTRDICMATLLLNGAGRYGSDGFFKLLRKKMFDLAVLSPRDLLIKYTKHWTCRAGMFERDLNIGFSSLGISIGRFLSVETAVCDQVSHFQKSSKLDVLIVLTGHYDRLERFNRELLITAEVKGLVLALADFYNNQGLRLQPLQIIGVAPSMKVFAVTNIATSRILLQQLTQSFFKKSPSEAFD